MRWLVTVCAIVTVAGIVKTAPAPKADPREALKPFNVLVGAWNGAGTPEGTADERQKGHWTEVLNWAWQFKGEDAWLVVSFDKGKHFTSGELRPLEKPNTFRFIVKTTDKQDLTFEGEYKDKYLTLERVDEKTKETQRLVFALLHSNRITYRYEVKPAEKTFFTKLYLVGATKEGEPFVAKGFNEKECVVSGGQGTTPVMFKGKTYYVCCSGCRDAFNENPEKYVNEFEAKRAKFNK